MKTSFVLFVARILDRIAMSRAALVGLRHWVRLSPHDTQAAAELVRRAAGFGDPAGFAVGRDALRGSGKEGHAALHALADQLLESGNADAAAELYRGETLPQGQTAIRVFEDAQMAPERAALHEPYVAVLSEVVLETDQCAIFDGGKVYWREISGRNFARHPFVNGRTSRDLRFFGVALPDAVMRIDQPFVLIGTDGATNYSHWLSRNVLKLALLDIGGVSTSLPLMLNHDLCRYQEEYLSLLGIPLSRLIPMKRGWVVRCREIHVPVILRLHPRMHVGIEWLRERVRHLLALPEEANDLLFVSRRDSQHRVLLNETELEAALGKLGFKTVVLGNLPVVEQIRAFSRARVIVGAHGAGLTNLMFAPPHATLIEITSTKMQHMSDFESLAQQMRQGYTNVVSGWYPERQREDIVHQPQRHDYLVHIDDVINTVTEVLDRPTVATGSRGGEQR